tara:strand:+ start:158 stop:1177 length:1020 start_codon:yes stop_codon:yes gene_type:complete
MDKLKFNTRSEKILVVAGCSHTQGSAFVKSNKFDPKSGNINNKGEKLYELASYKLKQKYGKDYITSDWLTKNLTWGGKLAKILKIKDVYNFGLGGLGIDAVIRSLFNYTKDIVSLRDHLFVIQIPCSDRKEFLANDYKIHKRENDEIKEDKWHLTCIKHYADMYGDEFGFGTNKDFKKEYFLRHFQSSLVEILSYKELLILQSYIEGKGGQIRFFDRPFSSPKTRTIQDEELNSSLYKNYEAISFHPNEIEHMSFKQIYDSLNIINLEDLQVYRKKLKIENSWTLHSDGTLPGDHHYNELGNQALAQTIFKNIDNKALPFVYQNVETKDGKEILGKSLF